MQKRRSAIFSLILSAALLIFAGVLVPTHSHEHDGVATGAESCVLCVAIKSFSTAVAVTALAFVLTFATIAVQNRIERAAYRFSLFRLFYSRAPPPASAQTSR